MDRRKFIKQVITLGSLTILGYFVYKLLTKVPLENLSGRFESSIILDNLEVPWSITPLSDEDFLVSERPGRLLFISKGFKKLVKAFEVANVGEAGLLGIAVHPEYPSIPFVYMYMSYYISGTIYNKIVRGKFKKENHKLSDLRTILDKIPGGAIHNGGRIRFGPDYKLYVTTGDAAFPELSQRIDNLAGKILRIEDDGSIPRDNPFPGSPIYSYGHRNPQGIDWHPLTGILVSSEHGPIGHDEVNVIIKGGNYGWPLRTGALGDGNRFIKPIVDFGEKSIAPSGASFVRGNVFREFRGDFLIACLRGERLVRIKFDKNLKILNIEHMFLGKFGRLRDVIFDNKGNMILLTSNRDGRGVPRKGDDKIIMISKRG